MVSSPRVSVIMPARNSEETIVSSLLSLQGQTVQSWELIVVDDASSDRTSELVKHFMKNDSRIRVISKRVGAGSGFARADGVRSAKAPIVAFLDSDDLWLPPHLDKALAFMETKGYRWVHTGFQYLRPHGQISQPISSTTIKGRMDLLGPNPVTLSTVLLRRDDFPLSLSYPFSTGQDWQVWVYLSSQGLTCEFFGNAAVIYRVGYPSVSSNKLNAALQRLKAMLALELGALVTGASYTKYLYGSAPRFMRRFVPAEDGGHTRKLVELLEQRSRGLRANILSDIQS